MTSGLTGTTAPEAGGLRFMTRDASDGELLAGVAANHIDWMNRLARCSGGTAAEEDGVHWTCVSRAATEVTAAVTEAPGPAVRDHLDRLLALGRDRQVDRVGYWAFSEAYRHPLGAWLAARGFRAGGRPHWMALGLFALPSCRRWTSSRPRPASRCRTGSPPWRIPTCPASTRTPPGCGRPCPPSGRAGSGTRSSGRTASRSGSRRTPPVGAGRERSRAA